MTKKELADRLIEENHGGIRITIRKLALLLQKRKENVEYLVEDLPAMYDGRGARSFFIDDIADQIMKKGLR